MNTKPRNGNSTSGKETRKAVSTAKPSRRRKTLPATSNTPNGHVELKPADTMPSLRVSQPANSLYSRISTSRADTIESSRSYRTPSTDTHSFENLLNETIHMDIPLDPLQGSAISPETMQRNQEVFTQLLKVGDIDEDHCRPGLQMTFQQFEKAKGLILDLLGYGMTPEDLIGVGLNRRLVVYCLRELKMRLPGNVAVDDIIPYGPPLEYQADQDPTQRASPESVPETFVETPAPTAEVMSPPSPQQQPTPASTPRTPPSPPTGSSKASVNPKPSAPVLTYETTGPSLFQMALPHQQINPLPPRPNSTEPTLPDPPASLPARPSFSVERNVRRQSTSSAIQAFDRPPTMFGEPRVASPVSMDVDDLPLTASGAVSPPVTTNEGEPPNQGAASTSSTTQAPTPLTSLRATVLRSMTTDSTRSSTPSSELGPKRGIKRPKADDFVDDAPIKRSALLNGIDQASSRRSTYSIVNSSIPDSHVFTWSDDDEIEEEERLQNTHSKGDVRTPNDLDAVQFAAAAAAIGLSMSAAELEAARLQEEERKAQLNAKAMKLLQTQAALKRLELKKAEKRLQNLQSGSSTPLADVRVVEQHVTELKQELATTEAKMQELSPASTTPVPEMSVSAYQEGDNKPQTSGKESGRGGTDKLGTGISFIPFPYWERDWHKFELNAAPSALLTNEAEGEPIQVDDGETLSFSAASSTPEAPQESSSDFVAHEDAASQ
ncbi:hypothetical protein FRC17_000587, partial [Serendipita sp. 399]